MVISKLKWILVHILGSFTKRFSPKRGSFCFDLINGSLNVIFLYMIEFAIIEYLWSCAGCICQYCEYVRETGVFNNSAR